MNKCEGINTNLLDRPRMPTLPLWCLCKFLVYRQLSDLICELAGSSGGQRFLHTVNHCSCGKMSVLLWKTRQVDRGAAEPSHYSDSNSL